MNPCTTCWRRNLRARTPRFRSSDHAYRSVDVAARRSSRACVNFRPGGIRRSGSTEPILALRVPGARTGTPRHGACCCGICMRSRRGVLIDLPHHAAAERVAATEQALDAGAPAIFEATFIADETFVAIDVLEKTNDGYRLTEVKSSSSQKDEHIPDLAIQARVAAACGVKITAAAVLHLNKEFRHPASGDLFARSDVTGAVAAFLPQVPDEIARQREMLAGPLPDVPVGLHCFEPRECPFMGRCWPDTPDHIRHLP